MASAPTESQIFVNTLKKCEWQVIVAIRNNLNAVAWFLEDKKIIGHKFYKRVTNPKTKEDPDDLAREVHEALKEKVEEDPSIYNTFWEYIHEISPVTATKLDEAYAELLGKQGPREKVKMNPAGLGPSEKVKMNPVDILKHKRNDLEKAFTVDMMKLANLMNEQGFLSDEDHETVGNVKCALSNIDKARIMVTSLIIKVEINHRRFSEFLDLVKNGEKKFPDVVVILDGLPQKGTAGARQSNSTANVPAGATGGTGDSGQVDIAPNVPTGTTEERVAIDGGSGNETPGGTAGAGQSANISTGATGSTANAGQADITTNVPTGTAGKNIIFKSDHKFKPLTDGLQPGFGLDLESVHAVGINGKNTRIAIIDVPHYHLKGIQKDHKALTKPPDENCDITFEKLFDENVDLDTKDEDDHALICTSIAVGEPFANGVYSKSYYKAYPGGVAPRAKATVFLVDENTDKIIDKDKINAAIDEVIAGDFHVLSLSFGGPDEIEEMKEKLDQLYGKTIVVAAAGNSGNNYKVEFPARHPGVIAVGSVDSYFKPSLFSADNDEVDMYYSGEVMAPCSDSVSNATNAMEHSEGTSMATPGIAGLACLIMQCAKKHDSQHRTSFERLMRRKEFMLKALNKIIPKDTHGKMVPNCSVLMNAFQDKTTFENLLL